MNNDHYPDDIQSYDNDPRSPFYVEPTDEKEETVTLPDGVLKRIQPMKKKATIVQAVTATINCNLTDEYWAVEYSRMNNWETNGFIVNHSADHSSIRRDIMRMETQAKDPGNKTMFAICDTIDHWR